MNFLKNIQIAKKYSIHPTTVANYIKSALAGNLDLKLIENDGRHFIADTQQNHNQLEELGQKAIKYRSADSRVVHIVPDELYEMLDNDQLLNLYQELVNYQIIPVKYTFVGKSGENYMQTYLETTKTSKNLSATAAQNMFKAMLDYLGPIVEKYDGINIIDAGIGAGYQLPQLFERLGGKLKNYVGINISQSVLDNIAKVIYPISNTTKVTKYILDIQNSSIQSILYKYKTTNEKTLNLVLLAGSTIGNFLPKDQVRVLRNLNDGMLEDDYLFVTNGIDNLERRKVFLIKENINLKNTTTFIPNLLGLMQEGLVEEEFIYNNELKRKEYNLILQTDIEIQFTKINKTIFFTKGTKINIHLYYGDTMETINSKLKESNMELVYLAKNLESHGVGYLCRIDKEGKVK